MSDANIGASFRALICAIALTTPMWSETPQMHAARPGSINYVEGQATIGGIPVTAASIGILELDRNQTLNTQIGRVEILLTPGVFLRLDHNSSVTMISPGLANTEVRLEQGRATVEVVDIRRQNDIRVGLNGAATKLLKKGLYEFDSECNEVRVFKGSADLLTGLHKITLGEERMAVAGVPETKSTRFDPRTYEDDFYRWTSLRSAYVAEASIDVAREFAGGGPGWYGPGWAGFGWYWNPWFGAYTFLPPNGIYYGPFGWAFYSPMGVYWSPFIFYGHSQHRFGDFHYPYGHGFPPPRGRGRR